MDEVFVVFLAFFFVVVFFLGFFLLLVPVFPLDEVFRFLQRGFFLG